MPDWAFATALSALIIGGSCCLSWLSHTGRLPLDGEEDTRTERWVRAHPRLSVAIPPGLFACFRLPVAIRAFTRGEPTSG